jgi:hypothetical protein
MLFQRKSENAKDIAAIQSDYERTFSTAHGRRVFADIGLMWGGFGGSMQGMRPEFREAFLWLLDRMGKNHVDNVQEMANALLMIPRVIPTEDELEPDAMRDRFEKSPGGGDIGTWRQTS